MLVSKSAAHPPPPQTLFSGVESKQRNWLSESDVSFFTGGGPSEADGSGVSPEEQDVVKVGVRQRCC
jgi:hypothetical protein